MWWLNPEAVCRGSHAAPAHLPVCTMPHSRCKKSRAVSSCCAMCRTTGSGTPPVLLSPCSMNTLRVDARRCGWEGA